SLVKSDLRVYEDTSFRAKLGLFFGRDVKRVPNPSLVAPASLRTAAEGLSMETLHALCAVVLHWLFRWAQENRLDPSDTWPLWTECPLEEFKTSIVSFLEAVPQLGVMLHISADKLAFRPEVDARERQRIAD